MEQLPKWIIPNKQPTFYDAESLTTIEMVARLYGATRQLIDEYNTLIPTIDKNIEDFKSKTTDDLNCFKTAITTIIENYIKSIDTKMDNQDYKIAESIRKQDAVIADAVNYMKTNLPLIASQLINQAIVDGTLVATLTYNPETEELSMNVGGEV